MFIFRCATCFDEMMRMISHLKEEVGHQLSFYKSVVVDESKHLLESIEDTKFIHYIEDLNKRLTNFRYKFLDMLDSSQMDWIDLYHKKGNEDHHVKKWPLFVMLVSAIICLSSSAIFHLFCAFSQKCHEFLSRMDYAGISILIAGSCYPPYYYFFYCDESKYNILT